MSESSTSSNPSEVLASLKKLGQNRLLAHLDTTSAENRSELLKQLSSLDFEAISKLLQAPKTADLATQVNLEPVESVEESSELASAKAEAAIQAGHLAAFTVAGGQGSRLGYEGPKGQFGCTPIRKAPLFAVFAEKIIATQHRYGVTIPWVLMTSPQNNAPTQAFFRQNKFFGLREEQLFFFPQGMLPAIDAQTGDFLLESPSSLALSPDGHGGSIKGLYRSGALAWLKSRGVKTLSYFQVDNPLVNIIDPRFIGEHILFESQFSSKTLPKRAANEKVGVFARDNGVLKVVEYSDLPPTLAQATDSQGKLLYAEGNIAIHLLEIAFIESIASHASMPYHRALKKVPFLDEKLARVEPAKPNAIKFEQFVFDAIALAKNPLLMRTRREEEFSPIKNAEGEDSPATSNTDQLRLWASWVKAAQIPLPTDDKGNPAFAFEISPLYADNLEAFLKRVEKSRPTITPGCVLTV